MQVEKKIAKYLLQIKAIKFNLKNPFLWSSGIKSPIYCDNRKTLSYPKIRNYICNSFLEIINSKFQNVELIAAVATGAIAHGMLLANALNLPFIYVRPEAKKHGMQKIIEGNLSKHHEVVVVEDLISTGNSCKKVVEILTKNSCNVLGVLAIFNYEFEESFQNFKELNCPLISLCSYSVLIETAISHNYLSSTELRLLQDWWDNPRYWLT